MPSLVFRGVPAAVCTFGTDVTSGSRSIFGRAKKMQRNSGVRPHPRYPRAKHGDIRRAAEGRRTLVLFSVVSGGKRRLIESDRGRLDLCCHSEEQQPNCQGRERTPFRGYIPRSLWERRRSRRLGYFGL